MYDPLLPLAARRSRRRKVVLGAGVMLFALQFLGFALSRNGHPSAVASLAPDIASATTSTSFAPEIRSDVASTSAPVPSAESAPSSSSTPVLASAPAAPEKMAVRVVGRAVFDVDPADCALVVDGVSIGASTWFDVAAGAHRVTASRDGYDTKTVDFIAAKGRTVSVRIKLERSESAEAPAAPPPEPVAEAEPEPPLVVAHEPTATPPAAAAPTARPATQLQPRKCGSCHSINPRKYSRAQWRQFFASRRHDRYVPLGNSITDMAAMAAYLDRHAADSEQDQGAGVR